MGKSGERSYLAYILQQAKRPGDARSTSVIVDDCGHVTQESASVQVEKWPQGVKLLAGYVANRIVNLFAQ
jgi:hypothetical protein